MNKYLAAQIRRRQTKQRRAAKAAHPPVKVLDPSAPFLAPLTSNVPGYADEQRIVVKNEIGVDVAI